MCNILTLNEFADLLKVTPKTVMKCLHNNSNIWSFAKKTSSNLWEFERKKAELWWQKCKQEGLCCTDVDQLIAGCSDLDDKFELLIFFLKLPKIMVSETAQCYFIDVLIGLFQKEHLYLYCSNTKDFYKDFIINLADSILNQALIAFDDLVALYRDVLLKTETRNILSIILDLFENRFPQLKERRESDLHRITNTFLDATLISFLDKHKKSVEKFRECYPNIYDIFVSPLVEDITYHSLPLYIFYCMPFFYEKFCLFIIVFEKNEKKDEYFENLEIDFHIIVLGKQNYKNIKEKISELITSTPKLSLYNISDKAYGIFTEIEIYRKLVNKQIETDFLWERCEIPIEEKKKKQKICDCRLFNKDNKCRIIEIKGKMPGFGAKGEEGILNDFFEIFSSSILRLLKYLFPEEDVVKFFPCLSFYVPFNYGQSLVHIQKMFSKKKPRNISREITQENEKFFIRDFFHLLYDFHIELPLAQIVKPETERYETFKNIEKSLYKNKFLENTITNVLNKFKDEKNRSQEFGYNIEKYKFYWRFSIPYTLIQDFDYDDSQNIAKKRIKDIQQNIKDIFNDMLSKKHLDLDNDNVEIVFL